MSGTVESDKPMRLTDAVAAIIRHQDGRYLLQLRDSIPDIPCPGHWGLFGGSIEAGEAPAEALRRELREELELSARDPVFFTRLDFDLASQGLRPCGRSIYLVPLSRREHAGLVLHEGADLGLFTMREILSRLRLAPYDAFVMWLYANRRRFTE